MDIPVRWGPQRLGLCHPSLLWDSLPKGSRPLSPATTIPLVFSQPLHIICYACLHLSAPWPLKLSVSLRKPIFLLSKPGFFLLASCLLHSGITYPQASNLSHVPGSFLPLSCSPSSPPSLSPLPLPWETLVLLGPSWLSAKTAPFPAWLNSQNLEKFLCPRSTPQVLHLHSIDPSSCWLWPSFIWASLRSLDNFHLVSLFYSPVSWYLAWCQAPGVGDGMDKCCTND